MLYLLVMAAERGGGPTSERVWLFIMLMVAMIIGTAVTGRKGRRK